MVSTKVTVALLAAVGLVLWAGIVAVLLVPGLQPPFAARPAPGLQPNVEIVLYAGEVGNVFAFGLSPDNLTSPGPTLRFKVGDVVRITVVNIGRIPHSFAITDEAREDARVVFPDSEIPSGRAVQPQAEDSVVFVADRPGEFAYICSVPGHVTLGMYGKVVIEG